MRLKFFLLTSTANRQNYYYNKIKSNLRKGSGSPISFKPVYKNIFISRKKLFSSLREAAKKIFNGWAIKRGEGGWVKGGAIRKKNFFGDLFQRTNFSTAIKLEGGG